MVSYPPQTISSPSSFSHRRITCLPPELKRNREKFTKELMEIGRTLRDVNMEQQLTSEIAGLESRIKFSNADIDLTNDKLKKNADQIKRLNKDIDELNPQLEEVHFLSLLFFGKLPFSLLFAARQGNGQATTRNQHGHQRNPRHRRRHFC
jgi:hypothetical protein